MILKVGDRTINTDQITETVFIPESSMGACFTIYLPSSDGSIGYEYAGTGETKQSTSRFYDEEAIALNEFWNEHVVTHVIYVPQAAVLMEGAQ